MFQGAYFAWKATAMGKNHINGKTFLEKRFVIFRVERERGAGMGKRKVGRGREREGRGEREGGKEGERERERERGEKGREESV